MVADAAPRVLLWPLPGLVGRRGSVVSAGLLLTLLLTRLLAFPDGPWEQDEAIFAAGVLDTDVTRHRPHPPGFPGWMLMGKAALPVVGDPLLALRLVSSVASVAAIYFLAQLMGPFAGGFATIVAVLVALVPGVWVHAPRAFATTPAVACLAFAAWAWRRGPPGWTLGGWVAVGLAVTIRPQLALVVPVVLPFGLRGRAWRLSALGGGLAGLVVAAAFGWVVVTSGGWEPFVESARGHFFGHMDRSVRGMDIGFTDLGLVRAAGGAAGVAILGGLWAAGLWSQLERNRGHGIWSLLAVALTLVYVLGFHHPGFPRYAVPVFFAMGPGLAVALQELGPRLAVPACGLLGGGSLGMTVPALWGMATTPLPPEAALRQLAGHESRGPVIYSHGQFAFARYARMTGRLRRPAVDASRPAAGALTRPYVMMGRGAQVLPGLTVTSSVIDTFPRGAWDLSQRRYQRVALVQHPVWIESGGHQLDRDRLGQVFQWLSPEVQVRPQPGAQQLTLVLGLDENVQRSVAAMAGRTVGPFTLVEGVNVVEIPLEGCGEPCRVNLEFDGANAVRGRMLSARLYGAWCEGDDLHPVPFRVSPGRPFEAQAHGVRFEGVEASEVFTSEARPGAWTNGDALVHLPVSTGAVELTLAQPPPRAPDVEITTGAGVHRFRAGASPTTVRVRLAGRDTVRVRSETRAPASYSPENSDARRLGAILFDLRWGSDPGRSP